MSGEIDDVEVIIILGKTNGGEDMLILCDEKDDGRQISLLIPENTAIAIYSAMENPKDGSYKDCPCMHHDTINIIELLHGVFDKYVVTSLDDNKFSGFAYISQNNNKKSRGTGEIPMIFTRGVILCILLNKPIFVSPHVFSIFRARLDRNPDIDREKLYKWFSGINLPDR